MCFDVTYLKIQVVEKKPCGGDADGDSKDDWNESGEWSESEDDEMGFGLFDDGRKAKESDRRGSFGYVEMDLVPTSIDSQIKQPKISEDMVGSIFRAQQLVRRSLTV